MGWSGAPLCLAEDGGAPPLPTEELWLLPGFCPGAGSSPRPGLGSPPAGEARSWGPARLSWTEAHSPHTPREGGQVLCGWVPPAPTPGWCPSHLHALPHQLTEGPTSPVRLAGGSGAELVSVSQGKCASCPEGRLVGREMREPSLLPTSLQHLTRHTVL